MERRSKPERKRHLNGAKNCDDFDGCEWGMGKIERKGISEGRGVATWAPHRANKMRRRCTVAKYCASVMTKITYQRGLSRRLFAFCLLIQLSFHYRHVEEGGTIPHILIMSTEKGLPVTFDQKMVSANSGRQFEILCEASFLSKI